MTKDERERMRANPLSGQPGGDRSACSIRWMCGTESARLPGARDECGLVSRFARGI